VWDAGSNFQKSTFFLDIFCFPGYICVLIFIKSKYIFNIMKKLPVILLFVILTFTLNAQTSTGISFIHTVTRSNLKINYTVIDNPNLNNNPGAVFFISTTREHGVGETSHIGTWYDGSTNKWTIYEGDPVKTLKINSTYTVFIPVVGTTYFNMLLMIPFKSPILNTGC
jgi:hypothetical protein